MGRQININISKHRSCDMEDCAERGKKVEEAYSIICMEKYHVRKVLKYYRNTRTISEANVRLLMPDKSDVPDPICGRLSEYVALRDSLQPLVQNVLDELYVQMLNEVPECIAEMDETEKKHLFEMMEGLPLTEAGIQNG